MIVAMQEGADEALIQQVIEHLVKMGFEVHRSTGARMTVSWALPGTHAESLLRFGSAETSRTSDFIVTFSV